MATAKHVTMAAAMMVLIVLMYLRHCEIHISVGFSVFVTIEHLLLLRGMCLTQNGRIINALVKEINKCVGWPLRSKTDAGIDIAKSEEA